MILLRVPPGWTTSSEGYFLNQAALADLSAAAKTYRLERDAWELEYNDLSRKYDEYAVSNKARYQRLEEQINLERKQWKATLQRARSPGFGIFAGTGVTSGGNFEVVVGAGLVWRLW